MEQPQTSSEHRDLFRVLRRYWFVMAQSREIRHKPFAARLLGEPVVLFRHQAGVSAFLDRCPHRHFPLSKGCVIEQELRCAYHGWSFDAAGVCRKIPGLIGAAHHPARNLVALPVHEADGLVWCSLDPDVAGPPVAEPAQQKPGFTKVVWTTDVEADLCDALENLLDGTHTHFVHPGLVRHAGQRQRVEARVRREADRVEVRYRGEVGQNGWISRWFEGKRSESFGRFQMPSTAQLVYRGERRTQLEVTAFFTPQDASHHRVFLILATEAPRWLGWLKTQLVRPFFKRVLHQDRAVLKTQALNRRQWPEAPAMVSTEIDLMRPHLALLLAGQTCKPLEKEVFLEL